ncbi:hypothetical protein OF83DRAFT_924543 [Amylostereum chailletii]|nr:hypothetical protein OF83DRAFT_924543 [Amylostereum chailletii]
MAGIRRQLLDGPRQHHAHEIELNIFSWARALMQLVYKFIGKKPAPMFTVPSMRLVQAALGVGRVDGKPFVVLLEEWINPEVEGPFRKYLGNGSALPFDDLSVEDMHCAEFLTFAQHVQYWKTGGLAFLADFQGGSTLLTDLQVVTAPSLGGDQLFGEGNYSPLFEKFDTEHICGIFCKHFGVPSMTEIHAEWAATNDVVEVHTGYSFTT